MDAKITYMEEWVHKAHDLLLKYDFKRSLLPTAVRHANVAIRDGLNDLLALSEVRMCRLRLLHGGHVLYAAWGVFSVWILTLLFTNRSHPRLSPSHIEPPPTHIHGMQRADVPFLVFSAGIADVIEEVCRQQLHHPLPRNVHIVSNRMLFDEEEAGDGGGDKLTGFTEPVFHVFNKRCVCVVDSRCLFAVGGGGGRRRKKQQQQQHPVPPSRFLRLAHLLFKTSTPQHRVGAGDGLLLPRDGLRAAAQRPAGGGLTRRPAHERRVRVLCVFFSLGGGVCWVVDWVV